MTSSRAGGSQSSKHRQSHLVEIPKLPPIDAAKVLAALESAKDLNPSTRQRYVEFFSLLKSRQEEGGGVGSCGGGEAVTGAGAPAAGTPAAAWSPPAKFSFSGTTSGAATGRGTPSLRGSARHSSQSAAAVLAALAAAASSSRLATPASGRSRQQSLRKLNIDEMSSSSSGSEAEADSAYPS